MEAAGVNSDYVEYMMGHVISTYHDVQSLGIERLRSAYTGANLSLRPPTETSQLEKLKDFAKTIGVDPERVELRRVMLEPDAKFWDPLENERRKIQALMNAIRTQLTAPLKSFPSTAGVAGPEGFEPSTIPRTSRMDSSFRLRASALESAALPG